MGGSVYGSALQPVDLGSSRTGWSGPAKGGDGGGAIRLEVTDTLTLLGTISSDGGSNTCPGTCSGAGGSGGSIYVTTNALDGAGMLSANGGVGGMQGSWPNGGGGGGRIALYYNTSTFTGTAESKGAAGRAGYTGEDGTVVFNSISEFQIQLQISLPALRMELYHYAVQFTDTSNGSPTTWNWSFGDGNFSIAQNPVHPYAYPGIFNVLGVTEDSRWWE